MQIVTPETKAKSLQAIREKISKTTDSKEKHALGQEARELRKASSDSRFTNHDSRTAPAA